MIDTLISIGNANGDEWYRMQAQRLMDDMIAQARSSGRFRLRQSREFVDLSYFQGPVGVAYTMLRLNDRPRPHTRTGNAMTDMTDTNTTESTTRKTI